MVVDVLAFEAGHGVDRPVVGVHDEMVRGEEGRAALIDDADLADVQRFLRFQRHKHADLAVASRRHLEFGNPDGVRASRERRSGERHDRGKGQSAVT
jgi:hypothetical protein